MIYTLLPPSFMTRPTACGVPAPWSHGTAFISNPAVLTASPTLIYFTLS